MFSKTGIGAIITVIVTLLNLFGVELPEGTITTVTEAVATLVGVVLLVWGQLSRKDLHLGLIRK